jgi:murein L,D-transpeptidase YcbB/YkuD
MSSLSAPDLSRRTLLAFTAATLAACGRSGGGGGGGSSQTTGEHIADPVAQRFYAARGGRTAWDQGSAKKLEEIIAGAKAHGLDPTAFAPKQLAGLSQDEALSVAALAYAKALASGFVDPKQIEPIFTLARNTADVAAGLGQALDRGDLEGWFASLPPQDPEYRTLSAAYLAALGQSGLASAPANGAPVGSSLAPADRSRQLAANLERRRWLTRAPPDHRIDVNTAGAFLGYFKPGEAPFWTRTVVGRDDHQTPSIQAAFHRLVANPRWRVPKDIAEKEILPKGEAYMARQDMRMVDGQVEQAPGPKSALGLVKFDVEDPYDIYLHDTPSKSWFASAERHRSHGCVRVQGAVDFARRVAAETGKTEAFDKALASQDTSQVDLGQSIGVRMLYHTAYFDQSGQVLYAPDVYGADDKLAAALGFSQAAAAARRTEPEVLFGP